MPVEAMQPPAPQPAPQSPPPPTTPPPTTPPPTTTPPTTARSTTIVDDAVESSGFLALATFGASLEDIAAVVGVDRTDWLRAEFDKPFRSHLDEMIAIETRGDQLSVREHSHLFWRDAIDADDQLRQRMVFALSQVIVISSGVGAENTKSTAYYRDILARHAFGNYRDLLEDITYSHAMAQYLTYLNNRKGDERSGRTPDENYAREIMQLFTIGVVELNADGTPKLNALGQPIETYDNEDVVGLAKVFTGLGRLGTDFKNSDPGSRYAPLKIFPGEHSPLEKRFLGTTIPQSTDAARSIDLALDTLINHPNTPPFIARQLIQRFTRSSPSPDYVTRVADAFATGRFEAQNGTVFGTGRRGDLEAMLAAILLDEEADASGPDSAKIREPILRFVHWARAFDVTNADAENEQQLRSTADPIKSLGQQPLGAPSVFNFYRPGYIAPDSETGARGLTAPEFQIVNEAATVGYANFMFDFVFNRTSAINGNLRTFEPDYSDEIALAADPGALADRLDLILLGGRMLPETRGAIVEAVSAMPLEGGNDSDAVDRAKLAVLIAVLSPEFAIDP
ncbi:MAG: DUF1800 domain-containing protein, partial [Pseudomonadota bacterium]